MTRRRRYSTAAMSFMALLTAILLLTSMNKGDANHPHDHLKNTDDDDKEPTRHISLHLCIVGGLNRANKIAVQASSKAAKREVPSGEFYSNQKGSSYPAINSAANCPWSRR
jgi:hypothetical protein